MQNSLWRGGQVEVGQSIRNIKEKKINHSVDIEQLDKIQACLSMCEQDPVFLLFIKVTITQSEYIIKK